MRRAAIVQFFVETTAYGIKFGSNFQPFVRNRDVSHGDDGDMTREPEMVKAYRDTWELGLHSYLTYLRDRLLLAQDLLTTEGSIFIQIGDQNYHHVRELLDEVFGPSNAVVTLILKKKGATSTTKSVNDFILWYCKDRSRLKPNIIYQNRNKPEGDSKFNTLIGPQGDHKRVTELDEEEIDEFLLGGYEFARVNYP